VSSDRTGQRPIGYWLKLIDGLIDDRFEALLGDAGLTRRHWQVLNLIAESPRELGQVDDAVRPFLGPGETSVAPILDDLARLGWAEETDGRWDLTPRGRGELEQLSAMVGELRRSAADGVSAEDYATTLRVMEQMAVNLGWAGG
jgi:DNA-binding MarR family transcriptional regulator